MLLKNYEKITQKIQSVCKECNRSFSDITIVAATKTIDAEIIKKLPKLGIVIAGENRCQELNEKYFKSSDLDWHFVGQLQTNKVKSIIDKVSLIQSLDRINLADEIDKCSDKIGKITNVLIEVNIGGEKSKSGVDICNYCELVEYVLNKKNICLKGLMAVLPINANQEFYLKMNDLFLDLKKHLNGIQYLSMGMSGDYETAIKCGANMVRLGTALFGARDYTKGANV